MKEFTAQDAKDIIEKTLTTPTKQRRELSKTPKPKDLAFRLNFAFRFGGAGTPFHNTPPKKSFIRKFTVSRNRTKNLLKSYNNILPDIESISGVYYSDLIHSTEEILKSTIVDLELIDGYLESVLAIAETSNHIYFDRGGMTPEVDFKGRVLAGIYEDCFGEEPRSSHPSEEGGEFGGPTIRFISACFENKGQDVSKTAIREAIDQYKRLKK